MANSEYKIYGRSAQFAPLSELAESVDYLDRTIKLGRANFPRINALKIGMPALCQDEFMCITAIAPGEISVKRGAADTVPAKHPALSLIWFVDNVAGIASDVVEHSAGETSAVKYAPYTIGGGALHVEDSTIDEVTYNWRQFRPYPPGQVRVRGDRWYVEHTLTADEPYMTVTWVHRDRTLQSDQLVDHDEPNIGPEPGTTYTVRIYNENGVLMRTEAGIMADTHDLYGGLNMPSWTYSWGQAMSDLDVPLGLEKGQIATGKMTIFSTRDGFDSWQGYEIPFKVNSAGQYLKVGQAAQQVAQSDDIEHSGGPYPPSTGVYAGQVAQVAAQPLDPQDYAMPAAAALYVANVQEGVGQQTSFVTIMNRNLFEAPYALLKKHDAALNVTKLVTVVARPADRLTDTHSIWTRPDYPTGHADVLEFEHRIDPPFTPWATIDVKLDQLSSVMKIRTSSFYDGVALDGVLPGQVALIDAEIVRIEARDGNSITLARGCYDTIPAPHNVGARMWFFEAAAGRDPKTYPLGTLFNNFPTSGIQVKMVPGVYGPPLNLKDIPTDRIDAALRTQRPYPPGEVLVNDKPWYVGAIITPDNPARITWRHRNRETQGGNAVDHHAPSRAPEDKQKYRLSITVMVYDEAQLRYFPYNVRTVEVDGTEFLYTNEMARVDGYRAGTLLDACGRVTVGLLLETVRNELVSWQGYVIPLLLPSYTCPPGQSSGGGQFPPYTGGGNGSTGDDPNPPPGSGGNDGEDNTGDGDDGDGPRDDDDGDNGNGPPDPPELPPDWPEPIDPIPGPGPDDPNPNLAGHWDTNWDRHWDAYNKDNQGN